LCQMEGMTRMWHGDIGKRQVFFKWNWWMSHKTNIGKGEYLGSFPQYSLIISRYFQLQFIADHERSQIFKAMHKW
jgi:hypothetical protein